MIKNKYLRWSGILHLTKPIFFLKKLERIFKSKDIFVIAQVYYNID